MFAALTLSWSLAFTGAPVVESICPQTGPANPTWKQTPGRSRAVVLIQGYHVHLTSKNVPKAELRPWQKADSPLVKALAKDADIYSFAYGQNVALEVIVKDSKLPSSVAELRKLGYTDIVLLGHSAGGLIARQFVEDNPDAGVTKVIQVCSPNAGSAWASTTVLKVQKPFAECLTVNGRKQCLDQRAAVRIPANVQFLCVVARLDKSSDTDSVVSCSSQWTADLQKQGVGAICVFGSHREVVRDAKLAETLADLVRQPQMRWPAERIEKTKKEIFRK